MALIKCDECGNMISDKSVSCPQCGYPTHLNKSMAQPQTESAEKTERAITNSVNPTLQLPTEKEEPHLDPDVMANERKKLWAFLVLFFVAVVIVLVCLFTHKSADEETTEASEQVPAESVTTPTEVSQPDTTTVTATPEKEEAAIEHYQAPDESRRQSNDPRIESAPKYDEPSQPEPPTPAPTPEPTPSAPDPLEPPVTTPLL